MPDSVDSPAPDSTHTRPRPTSSSSRVITTPATGSVCPRARRQAQRVRTPTHRGPLAAAPPITHPSPSRRSRPLGPGGNRLALLPAAGIVGPLAPRSPELHQRNRAPTGGEQRPRWSRVRADQTDASSWQRNSPPHSHRSGQRRASSFAATFQNPSPAESATSASSKREFRHSDAMSTSWHHRTRGDVDTHRCRSGDHAVLGRSCCTATMA